MTSRLIRKCTQVNSSVVTFVTIVIAPICRREKRVKRAPAFRSAFHVQIFCHCVRFRGLASVVGVLLGRFRDPGALQVRGMRDSLHSVMYARLSEGTDRHASLCRLLHKESHAELPHLRLDLRPDPYRRFRRGRRWLSW